MLTRRAVPTGKYQLGRMIRLMAWFLFVCIAATDEDPGGSVTSAPTGRITTLLPGLLGNLMFDYAVLLGVADLHRLEPHLSVRASVHPLGTEESAVRRAQGFVDAFGILLAEGDAGTGWNAVNATLGWGRFDPNMVQQAGEVSNARLNPSFSFKYFQHMDRDVFRNIFRFPQYAEDEAVSFLGDVRRRFETSSRLTIAGIHVRRGDKLWEFDRFNQWSHDAGYVVRAMQVLMRLYGENLAFVVTTDDPDWAAVCPTLNRRLHPRVLAAGARPLCFADFTYMLRNTLCFADFTYMLRNPQAALGHLPRVVISPHRTPQQCKMEIGCQAPLFDMCLLARTDAVVVSGSSTYSWWAGFLSADSGVVVAPRLPVNPTGPFGPCDHEAELEAPGPGRTHARCRAFWSEDYFPPDWVLLDEDPAKDVFPAWWGHHVVILPPHDPWGGAQGGHVRPGLVVLRIRISHQAKEEITCVYAAGEKVAALAGEGSGMAEVEVAVGVAMAGRGLVVGACGVEGEQCADTAAEACRSYTATLELRVAAEEG